MKINITNKEFRNLLDLLYLADWMITSHDDTPTDEDNPYHPLIQKFYAHAKDFGCESLVEFSDELQMHFPSRQFENESAVRTFVDSYDDTTFWEELISRLADRDFARLPGNQEMSLEERIHAITNFESKYVEKFETNGINSIDI